MSTRKRYTTWQLWVKFYLGQNEDCSPGGSTPDSSERLRQGGSRGRSVCKVLLKGGSSMPLSAHFTEDFLLVLRIWCHHEGIQGFSRYEEIRGVEIIKSVPKNIYLKNCLTGLPGAQSASLHPELPRGVLTVSSCSSTGFSLLRGRWQMSFSFSLWQCSWQVPVCSWQNI